MYPFWRSSSNPEQASSSSGSVRTEVPTQARKVNDSLFELYKPQGAPRMQVLFFNGLQLQDSSDLQFSTWSCGDGSCWPQTWLVKKFPGAHVLSVSYNGSLKKDSQGVLDMYLVGENLTSDLLEADIGQILDCPIILVGHSFGGLVIKQLYCHAHDKLHSSREGFVKAKLKKFLDNIRGIFYYATPHRGSKLVGEMAKSLRSNPLLEYFQSLSTDAARLNSNFNDIRGKYGKLEEFGLAEGLKTKLKGFKDEMLVSEASARDGSLYTVIRADHFSICQPENECSASFLKLKTFVEDIARDSEAEANNRKEAKAREDNRFDNHQYLPASIRGIEVPVQKVTAKLDNAQTVGIVGMGGLGKTTLAKSLFNRLSGGFEYSCFVLEVKKIEGDMFHVKSKAWKMMHRGGKKVRMEESWSSLKEKRLFLVLDDISTDRDLTVLLSIVEDTSPESRFIVTSRDRQLLERLDGVFDVDLLDKSTARQVFVSHAFGQQEEPQELRSFVDNIVGRCGGLPLSLEVVGKSLYRRGYEKDWEQTEHSLANASGDWSNLDEKLWANLRVSYDRLTEKEKNIFLDVTTFFSGNYDWTLQDAKAAWRVLYDTKAERLLWQTLVNLSLVYNVADDEVIKVHEQLQSLGRKIAAEERGVWERSAGIRILQNANGSDEEAIFSLRLDRLDGDHLEEIHIPSSALQRLGDVRYMNVDNRRDGFRLFVIDGVEECEAVPTKLVLLSCGDPRWSRVLLHSNLSKSLVGLILIMDNRPTQGVRLLRYSKLRFRRPDDTISGLAECMLESTTTSPELTAAASDEQVLHQIGRFSQLEVLKVDSCPCLSLPVPLGQLKKLRHLVFYSLMNLRTLPTSLGQLENLSYLHLMNLGVLESLPESFGLLKALSFLRIEWCYNLRALPDSFGELSSLKFLGINDCREFQLLPESFGQLKTLSRLEIGNCASFRSLADSFGELSSLTYLCIFQCHKLCLLPESFGQLKTLCHLQISVCSALRSLPDSFGNLSSLNRLEISACEKLDNLPKSFGELQALDYLKFEGLEMLHAIPDSLSYLKFRHVEQDIYRGAVLIMSRFSLEEN